MNAAVEAASRPIAEKHSPVLLFARVLMASLFLVSGVRKLLAVSATAAYFAKLGVPAAEVMVYAASAVEIIGAIAFIVGLRLQWVASALAVFTVIATLTAHRFWEFDAAQMPNQLSHFLKNLAVLAGLIAFAQRSRE